MPDQGSDVPKPRPTMLDRQQAANAAFNDYRERAKFSFEVSAGYGRWLIGSLVLVHGGALFGMFSFLDSVAQSPAAVAAYRIPVWCFVIGLFLALVSGFGAWLNWKMVAEAYLKQARVEMLWNPDLWIDDQADSAWLPVTYYLGIWAGIASGLMLPIGAATMLHGDLIAALLIGKPT